MEIFPGEGQPLGELGGLRLDLKMHVKFTGKCSRSRSIGAVRPQCLLWVKPGLPPWGPHVRFRRVQTLVREGSPLVKLRNSASKVQSVDQRMRLGMRCRLSPTCGRVRRHVRGSYVPNSEVTPSPVQRPVICSGFSKCRGSLPKALLTDFRSPCLDALIYRA
jgi:hypothetical protein